MKKIIFILFVVIFSACGNINSKQAVETGKKEMTGREIMTQDGWEEYVMVHARPFSLDNSEPVGPMKSFILFTKDNKYMVAIWSDAASEKMPINSSVPKFPVSKGCFIADGITYTGRIYYGGFNYYFNF